MPATNVAKAPPTASPQVEGLLAIGVDSKVAFCVTSAECVPAIIKGVMGDGRVHLKATIYQQERFRNPDRDSMQMFKVRWVQADRLHQRVRPFDPPVQRPGDDTYAVDSFTLSWSRQQTGGPLTAGTWFDPQHWSVSVVATRFEEKERNIVISPEEIRTIGEWLGSDFGEAYAAFERERREGGWDRLDQVWRLEAR